MLTAGVLYAISAAALANPAAPQKVLVPALAYDEDEVSLAWEKPADYADVAYYNIYENGKCIGNTKTMQPSAAAVHIQKFYQDASNQQAQKISVHNYTAANLTPSTRYSFTVRSVDAKGQESADSPAVVVETSAAAKRADVTSYGAKADGKTVNTAAIQKAIDACPAGGTVYVPAGTFKTGALWLKSDMTLELAQGAVLLGSENPADYAGQGKDVYAGLLNAAKGQNIRIVGAGTVDGNGWQAGADGTYLKANNKEGNANHVKNIGILAKNQVEAQMKAGKSFSTAYAGRSTLVKLNDVTNLYLAGVTFRNPANHTVAVAGCTNVTFNGVTLASYNCNNGDGIEDSHSQNVTVMNAYFDTGDDCMNYSAGIGAAAAKNTPTAGSWVFDNYFAHGHGGIVTGSHTGSWIQDILAEDNVMVGTNIGYRAKTGATVGGGARNVIFRDSALKNMAEQGFMFTSNYTDPNAAKKYASAGPGQFRDITIENCTIAGTKAAAIEVDGLSQMPHTNLTFRNLAFTGAQPLVISNLTNSTFTQVTLDGKTVQPAGETKAAAAKKPDKKKKGSKHTK